MEDHRRHQVDYRHRHSIGHPEVSTPEDHHQKYRQDHRGSVLHHQVHRLQEEVSHREDRQLRECHMYRHRAHRGSVLHRQVHRLQKEVSHREGRQDRECHILRHQGRLGLVRHRQDHRRHLGHLDWAQPRQDHHLLRRVVSNQEDRQSQVLRDWGHQRPVHLDQGHRPRGHLPRVRHARLNLRRSSSYLSVPRTSMTRLELTTRMRMGKPTEAEHQAVHLRGLVPSNWPSRLRQQGSRNCCQNSRTRCTPQLAERSQPVTDACEHLEVS
jgi:hypothetical protein